MNAAPLLAEIARALSVARLEAVLIGNAAAALRGAPVTTLDFDFMFRKTPANLEKLKRFTRALGATMFQPFYPVSGLYRAVDEERGLQVDFLSTIHGVRSFPSLRSRASEVIIGSYPLQVASLEDIICSKEAAGRPRDLAVLHVLKTTLSQTRALEADPGGAPRSPPGRE